MTLSNQLKNVLNKAFQVAKDKNHEFVTPEHILFVALDLDVIKALFLFCGVDGTFLQDEIKGYLDYSLIYDRIEIDNFFVDDSFRGQGIGKKLWKEKNL